MAIEQYDTAASLAVTPAAVEEREPRESLNHRVFRGAVWTIVFSLVNKGVAILGQIALAWFLFPEDYGLIVMALCMTAPVVLLTSESLQTLLIQHPAAEFHRLAGHVFWLSLTLNGLAGILILMQAMAAAWVFQEPRLAWLLATLGLTTPIGALATVHSAKLSIDLRFKALATIAFTATILQTSSSVLLAAAGFGPLAIILPHLWVRAFHAVATRVAAGRISIGRPQPRAWAQLLVPAGWLMLQFMMVSLQNYTPGGVIGALSTSTIAGLYYWSYQLSSQTALVLAVQLQQVVFPWLTRLNAEAKQQFTEFRRAARLLSALLFPACVLQAILAGPVIHMIFAERWGAAIPIVCWLSLAMSTAGLQMLSNSLIMAKGFVRALTLGAAVSLALVLAGCSIGGWLGTIDAIAIGSACAMVAANCFTLYLVCRCADEKMWPVCRELIPAFTVTASAGTTVWILAASLSCSPLLQACVASAAFAVLYGIGARAVFWDDFRLLLRSIRRAPPSPASDGRDAI